MQWPNFLDKFSSDMQRSLSKGHSSLIDKANLDTTFLGMLACFGYVVCQVGGQKLLNMWLDEFNMRISPYFAMLQNHLIVLIAYWVRYTYGNQTNPIFKAFDGCTSYASSLLLALVIFFPEMKSKTEDSTNEDLRLLPKSFHGEIAYMFLLTGWFFIAPVYLGWVTASPLIYLFVGWERITSTLTRCLIDHLRSKVRDVHGPNVGVYFDIFLDSSRVLAMFHIVKSDNKKGLPVGFVEPSTLFNSWIFIAPFVMKMYGLLVKSLKEKKK